MVDDDDDTNAQSKGQFNYLADDDNLVLSFVKHRIMMIICLMKCIKSSII